MFKIMYILIIAWNLFQHNLVGSCAVVLAREIMGRHPEVFVWLETQKFDGKFTH